LQAIPGIIRQTIDARPHARVDRTHFKAYRDFALIFQIVYYVQVPDLAIFR
jgi:hypothetical protein